MHDKHDFWDLNINILKNQVLIMRALRPLLEEVSNKTKARKPISDLVGALSTRILDTQKIVKIEKFKRQLEIFGEE